MDQKVAFYGLLAIVAAFVCKEIYNRVHAVWAAVMERRKAEADAKVRLAEALDRIAPHVEAFPQYVKGLISVCEAQVKQYEELRKAIESFTATITGPRKDDGFTEYDPTAADKTYRVQTFMAQGMTMEEAEAKAALEQDRIIFPMGMEV